MPEPLQQLLIHTEDRKLLVNVGPHVLIFGNVVELSTFVLHYLTNMTGEQLKEIVERNAYTKTKCQ